VFDRDLQKNPKNGWAALWPLAGAQGAEEDGRCQGCRGASFKTAWTKADIKLTRAAY